MIKIVTHGKITEWRYASNHLFLRMLAKPFWTSCYLIDGLLIDSGAPASVDSLRSFLASLGPDDFPEQCVITHWHEDHSGGARMLGEKLEIPVFANERSIDKIYQGFSYPFYRVWAWGGELVRATDIMPIPELPFRTRSREYTFDIKRLSGHADGLIALLEKTQGWAFVSDALKPRYEMLCDSADMKEDIAEIYQAVKMLIDYFKPANRPLTLFISGHGVYENGMEFLQKQLVEIETLHETALRLKNGGLSEKQILKKTLGSESFVGLLTGRELSKMNLLRSLLSWKKV